MLTAVLALALVVVFPPGPPRDTLRYEIAFRGTDSVPRLEVVLHFRAADSVQTRLRLPSTWAGEAGLYRAIRRLRLLSPGAELSWGPDSTEALILHAPGADLALAYDVVQDWAGAMEPGDRHRAVVQRTWFHVIGHNFLVFPDIPRDRLVSVRLRWSGAAAGVSLAGSFGGGEAQSFVGPFARVRNALFLGGDYRVRTMQVAGRPVSVAVRGAWRFPDSAFDAVARRIIASERGLWRDRDFPHYLVALAPWRDGYGGTRLEASFTVFADSTVPAATALAPLLAHELTHEWIGGGRLQPAPGLPDGSLYWFTEGFTSFYTTAVLRRMGLMTAAAAADTVNWSLRADAVSPYATTPYDSVAGRFWTDRDAYLVPYVRGCLLALRLDTRIRERSGGRHSLDDAIRRLLAGARGRPAILSDSTIAAALAPDLPDAGEEIARHIHGGEPVRLPDGALGPGFVTGSAIAYRFELGFDLASSRRSGTVAGAEPAGPAYAAGLRDGMRIKHYSIWGGNPDRAVQITVADGDSARIVRYLPRSAATVTVQQFLPARSRRP